MNRKRTTGAVEYRGERRIHRIIDIIIDNFRKMKNTNFKILNHTNQTKKKNENALILGKMSF